jgi:hypothetical protein
MERPGVPPAELVRLAEAIDRQGAGLERVMAALERIHDDDPTARAQLRAVRETVDYDLAFTVPEPLVSVIIPTWNRTTELAERAIPSALAQTHQNIEVVVVGDASPPDVAEAVTSVGDARVRFHNLTLRGPYSPDPRQAWLAYGTPPFNAGLALARGAWIAPLGDDDEFRPDHVERLLSRAREERLEFVYGALLQREPDGTEQTLGGFPPAHGQIGLQAALYHAGLRFIELELGHALFGKPNDWGMIDRMMRAGVRMGMVQDATVVYWTSLRGRETQTAADEPASEHLRVLREHLDQLKEQMAALEASLAAADEDLVSARSEIVELQLRAHRSEALAGELRHDLGVVVGSRSWRLTSPLRRIGRRAPGSSA